MIIVRHLIVIKMPITMLYFVGIKLPINYLSTSIGKFSCNLKLAVEVFGASFAFSKLSPLVQAQVTLQILVLHSLQITQLLSKAIIDQISGFPIRLGDILQPLWRYHTDGLIGGDPKTSPILNSGITSLYFYHV